MSRPPQAPVIALPLSADAARACVFEDPQSKAILKQLQRIAPSAANVLLVGDTGTGKELIARHLHALSTRRSQPFVAVDCGVFSELHAEAELFGHEKGAFTGALSSQAGWLEVAHGGSLLLDEINQLPMSVQTKLVRVLQEGMVVRLGSRRSVPVDVRIITASHVPLERLVQTGAFRRDLFYHLNVVKLELKPLQQRPGDILPLVRLFIGEYSRRLGHGPVRLSPAAERRLTAYPWPGNIRELENVIHRTLLISRNGVIQDSDLSIAYLHGPPDLQDGSDDSAEARLQQALEQLCSQGEEDLHEKVEDSLFRTAYRLCHHNQVRTAALLGLSRNVVRARLIRLGEVVVHHRGED